MFYMYPKVYKFYPKTFIVIPCITIVMRACGIVYEGLTRIVNRTDDAPYIKPQK